MEKWTDITGYEGLYLISSLGRVYSFKRNRSKGGFLKLTTDKKTGYRVITLSKNGVSKIFRVHRLVANAFIPNPNNYPQVDHILPVSNGGDDSVENLRWVSVKTNANNVISLKNKSKAQINVSQKKSQSMQGKCVRKLLQYDKKGNLLNVYPNIKYTCIDNGWNYKTITTAIYKNVSAYGYFWKTSQSISVQS